MVDSNAIGQNNVSQPLKQRPLGMRERLIEPTYLCFLGDNDEVDWQKVSHWRGKNSEKDISYVFISFFSDHFPPEDYRYLDQVGVEAARKVNANAHWISTSCLYDLDEEGKERYADERRETIWAMSDIIRGSRAVTITVREPLLNDSSDQNLLEWGECLRTMPELLLLTGDRIVIIYERQKPLSQPWVVPRKGMFKRVWRDTPISSQLIDRYKGSVILTPLGLVDVA